MGLILSTLPEVSVCLTKLIKYSSKGRILCVQGLWASAANCNVELLPGMLNGERMAWRKSFLMDGFASLTVQQSQHLSSLIGSRSQAPMKRHLFSSDAAVQTENSGMSSSSHRMAYDTDRADGDEGASLTASELLSILKWSQEISSDINLTAALQRLTEIVTGKLTHSYSCAGLTRLQNLQGPRIHVVSPIPRKYSRRNQYLLR